MNSPYAYVLEEFLPGKQEVSAVFSWPNCAKKYLRDTYTVDGELHLPPATRLKLTRHKVNPKSGRLAPREQLDIGAFLAT